MKMKKKKIPTRDSEALIPAPCKDSEGQEVSEALEDLAVQEDSAVPWETKMTRNRATLTTWKKKRSYRAQKRKKKSQQKQLSDSIVIM